VIKIDNAPDPKRKAAEAKPAVKKEKVNIYKFSEDVLHELSDDNVPSTPTNYSIYFEKMLDGQSDEFRKEIGDIIVANSESSVPTNGNISIEKEVKQGFIQIKSMLQAVVLIYKNLGVMRSLVQKRMDGLKNNTNAYEVYNKKFLVATISSEIESVKRYGYNASFLLVKIKDKFANRVKNLKERNNMFKSMSQLLLRTSRRSDIVAHYGDGCFAMVMKYTDENGTKQACARILNMLSSMPWKIDNEECKLDVQIVSSMISKTKSTEELLSHALDKLETNQDLNEPLFLDEKAEN